MNRYPFFQICCVLALSSGFVHASPFTVTTPAGDSSPGSLGAALSGTSANATSADTISFASGFDFPQSITLTASYTPVAKNLGAGSFSLSAPALLTLNDGGFTTFSFSGGATFSLSDLSLKGTGTGLALGANTIVAMNNVTIADGVSIAGNGFNVASGTTSTISGKITGSGGLTETGTGTLVLSGTNSYLGGTGVSGGGAVSVSSDANLGNATGGGIGLNNGTLITTTGITTSRLVNVMSGGGTISVSAGQTSTFSGQIGGFGKLTASGPGTLVLANAQNVYGGTAITGGGTLSVAFGQSLGTGNISINGSTLQTTGTNAVNVFGGVAISNGATINVVNAAQTTMLDTVTGSGGLKVTGSGTLRLEGSNTFTGGITVTGATLSAQEDYDLGDSSGGITLNGGTLAGVSTARAITLGTNGGTLTNSQFGETELSGAIGGGGGLTVSGSGTVNLAGTTNGYSGGTMVTGGAELIVTDDGSMGNSSGGLTLNNGTLAGPGTGSMTISRTVTLGSGGGTVSSGFGFQTLTLAGKITGSGALNIGQQSGFSFVALSGTGNDYSGGTTVNFGATLLVQNGKTGSATGTGALTVDGAGKVEGAGTIHASSFAFQGGTAIVGNGTDVTSQTTITGATASTFTQAELLFNLGTGAAQGESNTLNLGSTPVTFNLTVLQLYLVGGGSVDPGTDYTLISLDDITDASGLTFGSNGQITSGLSMITSGESGAPINGYATGPYAGSYLFVDGNNIDVAIVPEPSVCLLLLAGLSALAVCRRWKIRARA